VINAPGLGWSFGIVRPDGTGVFASPMNADELRAAAATLTEIADALGDAA
jgi:hypothetical protein